MPTPIYDMAEMIQSQANPHVIFNEAIRKLEVLQGKVAQAFLNAPPGSPPAADGYVAIVGVGTGIFAGHDNEIAYVAGGGWVFVAAQEGEIWAVPQSGSPPQSRWYRRSSPAASPDGGWVEITITDVA